MKKRIIILLISLVVIVMMGCKKDEPVSDFIPTQAPTPGADNSDDLVDVIDKDDEDKDDSQDNIDEDNVDVPDDTQAGDGDEEPVYVGATKPMYAKLNKYDSTLYVRDEPSTDGNIIGFLVHTERIEVIKIENDWASFVFTDGKIRYVNAKYLVDYEPAKLVPPTPTPAPSQTPTPSQAPASTPVA